MKKADIANLLKGAARAAENAYCPYSQFRVGAAVLAADGTIFTGCNVENASYGLTICAERNAIWAAVAAGCREFQALAVVTSSGDTPYPCGACGQVIAEFCGPSFPVYAAVLERLEDPEELQLGGLLPKAFKLDSRD